MATYFDAQFTGTLNTLLSAYTADTGGGMTAIGTGAMRGALTGDGYVYRSVGGTPSVYYKRTTTMEVNDYQVDLIFKAKSVLANDIINAYARASSSTSYYDVDVDQTGTIRLRVNTGSLTTLATGTVVINAGETHTMSIRCVGSTITMLWDGVVVTATSGSNPVTNSAIASGGSCGVQVGHGSSTAQTTSTGFQADRLTAADVVTALAVGDMKWLASGASNLGGTPGAEITDPTTVFDPITNPERISGDVEYRLVYLKNTNNSQGGTGFVSWISSQTTSSGTDLAIGAATQVAGTPVTEVSNESTAPVGVTFTAPSTLGAGISLGDLAAGEYKGLWLRRTVGAGTPALASDAVTFNWNGTPA